MSFTDQQLDRYARHIILKEIGGAGQQALLGATVALIGAGGIGSPAIQYLAAAGVGCLVIADDDRVELSNLQRQTIFTTADVGRAKVEAAAAAVKALNPDVAVETVGERIDAEQCRRAARQRRRRRRRLGQFRHPADRRRCSARRARPARRRRGRPVRGPARPVPRLGAGQALLSLLRRGRSCAG